MELFHDTGHITDAGLHALQAGTLDELGRLEIAEHLSFCDECLERYTRMLDAQPLLQPQTPVGPAVKKKRAQSRGVAFIRRYAPVAAAACLLLAMWGSGLFGMAAAGMRGPAHAKEDAAPREGFMYQLSQAVGTFMSDLSNAAGGLFAWQGPAEKGNEGEPLKAEEVRVQPQKQDEPFRQPKEFEDK